MEENVDEINRRYWGFALTSVVMAWGVSHVASFAEPLLLLVVGAFSAGTVMSLFMMHGPSTPDRMRAPMLVCASIMAFAALIAGGFAIVNAVQNREVLFRRCIVIEREMMRGQPRRDDLPDLFQALGCRPQLDEAPRRPAE